MQWYHQNDNFLLLKIIAPMGYYFDGMMDPLKKKKLHL